MMGRGDARNVRLLKRVRADGRARDLPGNADHRRRIELRGRDARHEVRCTRPGCRHGDPDPPGGASVTVGHMSRSLLVANEDVMDLRIEQSIINRQDSAPGVSEDDVDGLLLEDVPNDLCASSLHGFFLPTGW